MGTVLLGGLWALGASAACSIVFNNSVKDLIWGSLVGALGWVVFSLVSQSPGGQTLGYLLGAFSVAFFAELCAWIIKNPATVYLLPALYPLVPGGGMFLTMRALVTGNMKETVAIGYSTLMGAGATALGIALASSLARLVSLFLRQVQKNKKAAQKSGN